MPAGTRSGATLRLAELLAAVSLATDLAVDAPFESALGDAVTALTLARLAGLGADDLADVYYAALLYHLGCTAGADTQARVGGGDDVMSTARNSTPPAPDSTDLHLAAESRAGG